MSRPAAYKDRPHVNHQGPFDPILEETDRFIDDDVSSIKSATSNSKRNSVAAVKFIGAAPIVPSAKGDFAIMAEHDESPRSVDDELKKQKDEESDNHGSPGTKAGPAEAMPVTPSKVFSVAVDSYVDVTDSALKHGSFSDDGSATFCMSVRDCVTVMSGSAAGNDDEAWEKLFAELTGGTEEGIRASRSRTNLQQDYTDQSPKISVRSDGARLSQQLTSNNLSPDTPISSRPRSSLSTPRLSLRSNREPLLKPEDRSIPIEALEKYALGKKSVYLEIEYGIPRSQLVRLVSQLKRQDLDGNGKIEYSEWMSFYHKHVKDATSLLPAFHFLLYQPTYSCFPPPIIILLFSILQIVCYVRHSFYISSLVEEDSLASQAAICSYLIYNPTKRYEVWRFFTYQFVHVNMEHIVFNTLMQLVVGVPLEMSQLGVVGTLRVVAVYVSGVILGSTTAALISPTTFLAGASAGVYALIAAHLATLILNWKEDGAVFEKRQIKKKAVSPSLNPLIRTARLVFVLLFTAFDTCYSIYLWATGVTTNTSYIGHLAGAFAGLSIGIVALENRKVEDWEVKLKLVCVVVYLVVLISAVLWHSIGTNTGYFPASNFNSDCHYTINTNYSSTLIADDHSHF